MLRKRWSVDNPTFFNQINIVRAAILSLAILIWNERNKLTFLNYTERFICKKISLLSVPRFIVFAHDIFTCGTRMMDMGNLKFERDIFVQLNNSIIESNSKLFKKAWWSNNWTSDLHKVLRYDLFSNKLFFVRK